MQYKQKLLEGREILNTHPTWLGQLRNLIVKFLKNCDLGWSSLGREKFGQKESYEKRNNDKLRRWVVLTKKNAFFFKKI